MFETLNDCIIIPHWPQWADVVKLRRSWATSIASGINGGEDRASERTAAIRKLSYRILADGIQERAALTERLKAALKSGRAVCPLWPRPQYVLPAAGTIEIRRGIWPWAVGEYVYAAIEGHRGINEIRHVACGATVDGWDAEIDYWISGGTTGTTPVACDLTQVSETTPPPSAVLQKCRYVDCQGMGPFNGIRYRVKITEPTRCKVRLWFNFFEAVNPAGTYRIVITGSTQAITCVPWTECEETYNQAGYFDFAATPDRDGYIDFAVYLVDGVWIQVNAIEVFSTAWQVLKITSIDTSDTVTLHFANDELQFPDWTDIKRIHPVLFGRLSVGDMEAITDRHGNIDISIEEPLSDAVAGRAGVCPIEICGITPTVPPPVDIEVGTPVDGACVYASMAGWENALVWTHDDTQTPNQFLTEAQIEANKGWLEAAKRQYTFLMAPRVPSFGPAKWGFVINGGPAWDALYYLYWNEPPRRATNYDFYWVLYCDVTFPP